jgi:hypothetical protein
MASFTAMNITLLQLGTASQLAGSTAGSRLHMDMQPACNLKAVCSSTPLQSIMYTVTFLFPFMALHSASCINFLLRCLQEAQQGSMLHMDMQPDEDDFMMEVGALSSCCPHLHSAEIAVSPRVSTHAAAESVKMLFIFQNLRQLQLRCAKTDINSTAVHPMHVFQLLLHITTVHMLMQQVVLAL